jgi:glucose/arabinose dehydrogenase/mono/diheme cytochrome c family protein
LHLVAFFLLIVENSCDVMMRITQIATIIAVSQCFSCGSGTTDRNPGEAVDSVAIKAGASLFTQDCSACHSFVSDGIGPQLGGVTAAATPEWVRSFILDPKGVIESGDERAVALNARFKTIMPAFSHYDEEQLDNLLAFLTTQKRTAPLRQADDPNALKDPIPEKIPLSGLRVDMELFAEIPFSSDEEPRTRITKMTFQPNTDKLFVVDLRGKLYQLVDGKPEVYLDMSQHMPNFIHKPGLATGFGSYAFHPDFQKNGLLYTSHTEGPGTGPADFAYSDSIKVTLQWVLTEWKTETPRSLKFNGTPKELFRVDMVTGIHGMQELTFNPVAKRGDQDYGLLYVGIGDGGSAESGYPHLCHDIKRIWGTVLRIDPRGSDGTKGRYGIPPGNPFASKTEPGVVREIFAYGFRNPHRISWTKKGQILVGNVGHHMIEALYMIKAGDDCGWPLREGTFQIDPSQNMYNIYPNPGSDGEFNFTYPVAQYDHDEGNAFSGGYEYQGSAIPALQGKYVFGDIVNGRLFYVEVNDLKVGSQAPIREWQVAVDGVTKTLKELCGADKVDERFHIDRQGELYISTKPDGKIYKLTRGQLQ